MASKYSVPFPWWRIWLFPVITVIWSAALGLLGSFLLLPAGERLANVGAEIPDSLALILRNANWLWLPTVVALCLSYAWLKPFFREGCPGGNAEKIASAFRLLCLVDGLVFLYIIALFISQSTWMSWLAAAFAAFLVYIWLKSSFRGKRSGTNAGITLAYALLGAFFFLAVLILILSIRMPLRGVSFVD